MSQSPSMPMPDAATIYLLARTELDRRAFRLLLECELRRRVDVESGFEAVGVWAAMRRRPALALAVADSPSGDVRDALHMIPRLNRATRVLVLCALADPVLLQNWGTCPVHGLVLKDGGPAELEQAIRMVLAGQSYFSDGVESCVQQGRRQSQDMPRLSRREAELLPLLAQGLSLRDAAARMTVSYKTADAYRTSLLRKLGLRDRVELTRWAIRQRIIEP